ncbi:unnamed protein product [Arabis nemorensis]|uniref:Uncharacterized protein n=1 Tax=Arabis nemorensis TaxID=586526 RepID=A0A565CMV5_9BRAS|nr:unnamed protein product [Arabis nemorensis]
MSTRALNRHLRSISIVVEKRKLVHGDLVKLSFWRGRLNLISAHHVAVLNLWVLSSCFHSNRHCLQSAILSPRHRCACVEVSTMPQDLRVQRLASSSLDFLLRYTRADYYDLS